MAAVRARDIHEDPNKAVTTQFYRNGRPAAETVRDQGAYEFRPAAIRILAGSHQQAWEPDAYQPRLIRCYL